MNSKKITPIRRQYLEIKRQYPNAILFFRLGDFYETFDKDAEITSNVLDIVLTARNIAKGQKVPMAGIPFHAAENYISRLIEKGYHVAICEQIGPQPKHGLFPRKVIRVITPGTVVESGLLKSEKNNFLASIIYEDNHVGIAFVDITTGEFQTTEVVSERITDNIRAEIARINPAEILVSETQKADFLVLYNPTVRKDWFFELKRCKSSLIDHFKVASLDGFGLRSKHFAARASGAIIQYLQETDQRTLKIVRKLSTYSTKEFMVLDAETRRNLELTETLRESKSAGSLLGVIDYTINPLGKRLIRQWLRKPLLDIQIIQKRLDYVESFTEDGILRNDIQLQLKSFSDLERIISRIVSGHAMPRDLVALRSSLQYLPQLKKSLHNARAIISSFCKRINLCSKEKDLLNKAITENPPASIQKTGVIKKGFSKELDEIINSSKTARNWITKLEKEEREKTGIKSLKVKFNKVFGYYIEVTKSNLEFVPKEYIRKQTLFNSERYITPEMKEYESIILNAEERIREIEIRLFKDICSEISRNATQILETASCLAELDVFTSLAEAAIRNNYCKPDLISNTSLEIIEGRHPVVEKMQLDKPFIANNVAFDEKEIIQIITGPNMSGKSTFLRQVALIILLAQIGSFVPAKSAKIGLVDRIFTRIGAQDEIYAGQSTFMVEMVETANLLNHATPRSLLILDEIGRGTSTYDGLSIAWAVVEYIHNNPKLRSRTLFATHYHELTQLSQFLPHVKNYNVAVSESDNNVIFLHKIIPGGADRSYGIHVAQLAGLPPAVVSRANKILIEMEQSAREGQQTKPDLPAQMGLFPETNPLLEEFNKLDLNEITPLEALNILFEWNKKYLKINKKE
ncbi:MAG TPA: DNA mismatch repair protein MutS [Anaerolineae bacterium]|nr:DNA mismatch repair protein MutS [Anaerolineae bacterium]